MWKILGLFLSKNERIYLQNIEYMYKVAEMIRL